jgi:integrase
MDYRIFRKPRMKKGKRTRHWYYYYLEEGRQVQKSCKNCRTRVEAEAYIRALPPRRKDKDLLIRTVAETMYIPGGPHMNRRLELGKPLTDSSMAEARVKIRLIISEWGDKTLDSLTVEEVGKYLFSKAKSGSWKRNFLKVLREIYTDAGWYGSRVQTPIFPKFAKNVKKADVLTTEELNRLFKPENFPTYEAYLFFLLSVGAGLRIGEAAAVRARQVIFEYKALIVDGFCRPNGERMKYNKKGTEEHPRARAVPLSEFVIGLMRDHIVQNNIDPESLCFRSARDRGRAIGFRYAGRVFASALAKAKIETGMRRLVPHSLRYTYVTQVRRELPSEIVMKMAGHINIETTEYYNKKVLDSTLKKLTGADQAVANLFSD